MGYTLWWTNIAIENGHRNSGCSQLKNGGSFHGKMLVHQRVVWRIRRFFLFRSARNNQCFVPRTLNQIYRIHPYTPRWDGFMVKHSMTKWMDEIDDHPPEDNNYRSIIESSWHESKFWPWHICNHCNHHLGKLEYFTHLNSSAIWGWFSLLTMIIPWFPGLSRSEVVIIYPEPYLEFKCALVFNLTRKWPAKSRKKLWRKGATFFGVSLAF